MNPLEKLLSTVSEFEGLLNEFDSNEVFRRAPALCSAIRVMGEALEFYSKGGNFNMDIWQHKELGYFTGKRAQEALQAAADRIGGGR